MKNIENLKPKLIGRMLAENIQNLSDSEMHRVFAGCVMPNKLIKYAKILIAQGIIANQDIITK